MCHILSSENRVPFSFKELKCSPRGAPSTNSIIIYSLSSVKQTSAPKIYPQFLRNNLSYEIATRHHTFPRLHLKGKSVMASRNVGCFLKQEIAPCQNNEGEVYSFQWSHHEMLFTDTKVSDLGSANAH